VFRAATGELVDQVDGRRTLGHPGNALANAGDMTGDGRPEVVIAAENTYIRGVGYAGRVYVESGAPLLPLYFIDGDEHFGAFGDCVAGLGDVDLDGFADFAVGKLALVSKGEVSVYSGATQSLDFQVVGGQYDWWPLTIAGAGDVDGDGHDDLAIGAALEAPNGVVCVISGATHGLLLQISGQEMDTLDLGWSLAGAGDLDGDGKDDLWIGAPGASTPFVFGMGAVIAYSVAKGQVLSTVMGQGELESFGETLANAGDVDGDGTVDFVAGGRANVEAGVVRVHSGKTGAKLIQLVGAAGDHVGESVAGAGDVDGDGRAEVVVGAPFADPHGVTDMGAVYILGL